MKRLFFALFFLIQIIACNELPSSETITGEIEFDKGFALDFDMPAHGGEKMIKFIAPEKWNVEISQTKALSWCSAHPSSGNAGSAGFTLYLDANDAVEDRKAEIRIVSGQHMKTLVVEQSGTDEEIRLVEFDDSSFQSAIEDVLGKREITYEDLAAISSLDLSGYRIRSMTDLRHFTALESLACPGNEVRDIILSYPGLSRLQSLAAAPNDSLERIWVFNETDIVNGISIDKSDNVRYAILASDNHFKVPLKGGDFDLYLRQGLSVIKPKEDYHWLRFECVSQVDEHRLSKWHLTIDETHRSEIAEFYVEDETEHEGAVEEIIQVYTGDSFWYPYSTTLLSDEEDVVKVADRAVHEKFEKKLLLEVSPSQYVVDKYHSVDITLEINLKDPETSMTYQPDSVFINKVNYPVNSAYTLHEEFVLSDLKYDVVVVRNGTYYQENLVIKANDNVSDDEYELRVTYDPTSVAKGSMVDVQLIIGLYRKGTDTKVTPDEIYINGKKYAYQDEYHFNEGPVEDELVYEIKVKRYGKEYLHKVVIPLNEAQEEYEIKVEYSPEEVYLDKNAQVVINTWLVEKTTGEYVTPEKVYINDAEYDTSGKYIFDIKKVTADLTYQVKLIYKGKEYVYTVNIPARNNGGGNTEKDYYIVVEHSPDEVTAGEDVVVEIEMTMYERGSQEKVRPDKVYINNRSSSTIGKYYFNERNVQSALVYKIEAWKDDVLCQHEVVIPLKDVGEDDEKNYSLYVDYTPDIVTIGQPAKVIIDLNLIEYPAEQSVIPDHVYVNGKDYGGNTNIVINIEEVRDDLVFEVSVLKNGVRIDRNITIPAQEIWKEYRIEIEYSPKEITKGEDALIQMQVFLYDISTGEEVKPDRVYINDSSVGSGGYYSWSVQNVQANLEYTVEVHKDEWIGNSSAVIFVMEKDHHLQFYGPEDLLMSFGPQISVKYIQLGVLDNGEEFDWQLSTTADWIYFDRRSGSGIHDVQMIINGSEYQSERQAQFRLEAVDTDGTVLGYYSWTVRQEGIDINIITESNLADFKDYSDTEFNLPTFFFTPYPSSVDVDIQTNAPGLHYKNYIVDIPEYDSTVGPLLELNSLEELSQSYIYHTKLSYPSNRVIDGSFPGKFRSSQIVLLPTNYVIDNWETLEYTEHYIINGQGEYCTAELQTYQVPLILTGLDYWYVAQAYSDQEGDYPNKIRGYDEDGNLAGNAVTIVNNVSAKLIYDDFDESGFQGWSTDSPREIEADGYSMNFTDHDICLADRKRRAEVNDEYLGPIYRSYSTYSYDRVVDLGAVIYAEVDMKDGEYPLIVAVTDVYQLGVPYFKADVSWLDNERVSGDRNFKVYFQGELEGAIDALSYRLNYDHAEFGVFSGFMDSIGAPSWNKVPEENGEWQKYKFERYYTASDDAIFSDTFTIVNDARIAFKDGTYLYCSEQMKDTYVVSLMGDSAESAAKNIKPYNYVEALPELISPADVKKKKTVHRSHDYRRVLHKSSGKTISSSELIGLPGFTGRKSEYRF